MPNFAYTNQTNFRPFSYQEMLAPVLMATQAHQALEGAYSELESQANAIGSLANEANDPVTYARYKSYENSLRNQADILAKNGLTPGSRKSLLDLKGRYTKEITPIQNAITRRRELADEQRKALLQNPTLMFQRDMNSVSYDSSLDRFLENPDYDYGERYSGALLTQQVSQAASNLAKELTNYGRGKSIDAFTNTFIQNHGYTREQVLDAINNPNRATSQPVLNAIVEQVIGSSGILNWADDPTKNEAYNYARQGLWNAVGQTQVSPMENYGARLAAQEASQKRIADYKASLDKPQPQFASLNPSPIYSVKEREETVRQQLIAKRNFGDLFYKRPDGKMVLSNKGWREYHEHSDVYSQAGLSGTPTTTVYSGSSPFKHFVDNVLGGGKYIRSGAFGRWQAENVGKLWEEYINSGSTPQSRADARKYTNYRFDIALADQEMWEQKILGTAVNNEFQEVVFDKESETFKPTGNTLSVEDLHSPDYSVVGVDFSSWGEEGRGNTFRVLGKDGKIKDYKLNPGINTTAENNLAINLLYARYLESVPDEGGYIKDRYGNAVFVTKQQADVEHTRALNMAQFYLSQLGVVNKVSPQEYEPADY